MILQATLDALDAIYTLVEQLTDATRSRRRIELLVGLRVDLCGAMDSFCSDTAGVARDYEGAGNDGGGRTARSGRRSSGCSVTI